MSSGSPAQLHKTLSAKDLFAIAFGATIGVGWIVVLGDWLQQAGPLGAVLGFVLGAAVITLVGLCYAEMATMLPAAGGEMAYTYEVYGVKTSFLTGWFLTLAYVAVTAFEAISVGWIVGALIPQSQGPVLLTIWGGDVLRLGGLLLGLGGMAFLVFVNYRGVKSAASLQDWVTYGLILASLLFIGAGLFYGSTDNLKPYFGQSPSESIWLGVLAIFMVTPNWLAGFVFIPQLMEEKAPGTPLRRAGAVMVLSIVLGAAFYCLVILAASMATPWPSLVDAELPVAAAFEALLGSPLLAKLVLVAGICGLVTTWNAVLIGASRVLFALGRARIISPRFSSVHPSFGSPSFAVLFVGAVGSFCVFLGRGALIPLLNVVASIEALAFLLISVGVIKLRRTQPDRPRPFRVPGGVVTASLAALGSALALVLALYEPYVRAGRVVPLEWILFLGWGALGACLWFYASKVRNSVTEPERRQLILGRAAQPD